jgi:hypothetical protein
LAFVKNGGKATDMIVVPMRSHNYFDSTTGVYTKVAEVIDGRGAICAFIDAGIDY